MAKRKVYSCVGRDEVCIVEQMEKAVQVFTMDSAGQKYVGKIFDDEKACDEYLDALDREKAAQGLAITEEEETADFTLEEIDVLDETVREHRARLRDIFITLCREDFAWECYLAAKAMLDRLKEQKKKTGVIGIIIDPVKNVFSFTDKAFSFEEQYPAARGEQDIYFPCAARLVDKEGIYFSYPSNSIRKFHKLCNKLGYSKSEESRAALSRALERLGEEQAFDAVAAGGKLDVFGNYNYDPAGDMDIVYSK